MKENLTELIMSSKWDKLSKEQQIDELQRQIDELKNETEYPVFCLAKNNGMAIVRFDSLISGIVVKQGVYPFGYKDTFWIKHTDSEVWKQLPYNKERGLYHTQLVWCWDYENTHSRILGFYDAINNKAFDYHGKINRLPWNHYEPFQGEWPEWAIEAHKTLEGLND